MRMHRGSFTVEASIYIPLFLFLIMNVLSLGIVFFQESRTREENTAIQELDIVQEFYNYQILGEIGEEIWND
ncbi:MAG: TadE/TadG family type IV pilus assembly protein [Agathobacter sp.]